jgi:hypothetical protein
MVIYWDGEETPGFTVYAVRSEVGGDLPDLEFERWSDVEVRRSRLYGEGWEVGVWDVRVGRWPSTERFDDLVAALLRTLVDDGFSVAWLGGEVLFASPPWLFSPDAMSGGVLAAYSVPTGLISPLRLDAPLASVSDADLLALRAATSGVAGRSN